jgi:predicted RNase H-like nuclease (RuvC/YqgF family)
MKWELAIALFSVSGTVGLGLLTYFRGTKSDQALNIATNVQNTFDAQRGLVDNLQEEVQRYQSMLSDHREQIHECENQCRKCNHRLAETERELLARDAEIASLKKIMAEHETTITKHEVTINRIARRGDMAPQPRQDDEERRTE